VWGELRNKEERDKQEAVDVMPMARAAVVLIVPSSPSRAEAVVVPGGERASGPQIGFYPLL
jgi:hypothetical protein